jgi:hypothetical protein
MNKSFSFLSLFLALSVMCWAGGNKDKGTVPQTQTEQQTVPQSEQPPAPLYWTGDGGIGLSIAIHSPSATGLTENQNYLPDIVQGEFVSNFTTYSAITVLDRLNLPKQYSELFSGYYADDSEEGLDLGHLTPRDYNMDGSITRTATGYVLQMWITRNADKITIASYSGTCTFAELDNLTVIRQVSLDLLQKIGVEPTERTRIALTEAASINRVNAQTALAQGINAQRGGTVIEAMTYYYEATAFDPTLLEAANRASVLSATITSGNIGENVRNDIKWRNEWIKILQEADNFYKQHHIFEIIYDPTLIQGRINYNNSTVDLSFRIAASPVHTAFNIINNLSQGLFNTGKSEEWGFASWPLRRFRATDVRGIWENVPPDSMVIYSLYSAEPYYEYVLRVNAELKNQNGKTIGTATTDIPYLRSYELEKDPRSGRISMPGKVLETVSFRAVKADDITDSLSVSIVSVNGVSAEDAARRGYMRISTGILP